MAAPGRQNAASFSMVFTTSSFVRVTESFVRAYELLEVEGYPDIAALLYREYHRFRDELKAIGRRIAAIASEEIKRAELDTRVRPHPTGDHESLQDYLGESVPLDAVPGSVGVNFEPVLEKNVSWWWTQEEGYSGHVGRVVHGFFYDAGYVSASRPDPGAFREHPLFRAEGPQRPDFASRQSKHEAPENPGKGVRPGMRIQNPIMPRRFVLQGGRAAEAKWHGEIKAAEAKFVAATERLIARVLPRRP
jgi:hypothetical protein